jgi:dihydrofolate reductase
MVGFADRISGMEKIVFSKIKSEPAWQNTSFKKELTAEWIQDEKNKFGKDLIVFGGPGFISQLLEMDPADEFYFVIQPVIAGHGARLFSNYVNGRIKLKLQSVKDLSKNAVVLQYFADKN